MTVTISLCAPLIVSVRPDKHLLSNIYSFHIPGNFLPFPLESQRPTHFLVQDDMHTSFSLIVFGTHVYSFRVCMQLNFALCFLLSTCLMSIWSLDKPEELQGVEEISSSPTLGSTRCSHLAHFAVYASPSSLPSDAVLHSLYWHNDLPTTAQSLTTGLSHLSCVCLGLHTLPSGGLAWNLFSLFAPHTLTNQNCYYKNVNILFQTAHTPLYGRQYPSIDWNQLDLWVFSI